MVEPELHLFGEIIVPDLAGWRRGRMPVMPECPFFELVPDWIRVDPARSVDFAANEGLRLEVAGQLRWKTAGVPVLLTIHSAQLLVTPSVVDDADGARLVFRPSLEKMDLKSVPGFIDSGITAIVNKRLEAEGDKLAWHFERDLANAFPMPKELVDIDSFTLSAGAATVEVLPDALVLNLSLTMGFVRRAPAAP